MALDAAQTINEQPVICFQSCRIRHVQDWDSRLMKQFFAALIHIHGSADCSMLLCCLASPYFTLTANSLWCAHCGYVDCRTVSRDLLQKAGLLKT